MCIRDRTYNENEIRRIAKRGFDIAMKRRKKVTSVDKANVLDSSTVSYTHLDVYKRQVLKTYAVSRYMSTILMMKANFHLEF